MMNYKYRANLVITQALGLFIWTKKGSTVSGEITIEGEIDALINQSFVRMSGCLNQINNKKMSAIEFDEILQIKDYKVNFIREDKRIHLTANLYNLINSRLIRDIEIIVVARGIQCVWFKRLVLRGSAAQISSTTV